MAKNRRMTTVKIITKCGRECANLVNEPAQFFTLTHSFRSGPTTTPNSLRPSARLRFITFVWCLFSAGLFILPLYSPFNFQLAQTFMGYRQRMNKRSIVFVIRLLVWGFDKLTTWDGWPTDWLAIKLKLEAVAGGN